jgi:NTE family protein
MGNQNIAARRQVAMVFSGGIGLGAYQAGAYATLHKNEPLWPDWVAGSSIGAVNGAVIAGNAPRDRVERLRQLWETADPWWDSAATQPLAARLDPLRHLQNWASVVRARLLGIPGYFRPRLISQPFEGLTSFYDLSPLRARIEKLVDFNRLNGGEVRFSVVTTDIESGDMVLFDTARGDRINAEHLIASCGLLPEFAPLEIDGRLLGDGGLCANAPVEAVLLLDDQHDAERVCFVVDLFARDGDRPIGLESALARSQDLLFGNQTYMRLQAHRRETELREQLATVVERLPADIRESLGQLLPRRGRLRAILYLSYRAPAEEAGPQKMFDLSRATVRDRWQSGALDMTKAIRELSELPRPSRGCVLSVVRCREE